MSRNSMRVESLICRAYLVNNCRATHKYQNFMLILCGQLCAHSLPPNISPNWIIHIAGEVSTGAVQYSTFTFMCSARRCWYERDRVAQTVNSILPKLSSRVCTYFWRFGFGLELFWKKTTDSRSCLIENSKPVEN